MEKKNLGWNPADYTPFQRAMNWLHYHKWWVLGGILVLALLLSWMKPGASKPDYYFAYVGSFQLPEDSVDALERELAKLGTDANGDGEVIVALVQYVAGGTESAESIMYGQATDVMLLADVSEAESFFFLMEDPDALQKNFQILAQADGSAPAEDDFDTDGKALRWGDCPALTALDLGSYESFYLEIIGTGQTKDLVAPLYVGRRYCECEYPEANEALWNAMTAGT